MPRKADPRKQTRTIEIRLQTGAHEQQLDELARFFAAARRDLHRELVKLHGEADALLLPQEEVKKRENALKRTFLAEHGVTGRQYNGLFADLKGRYAAVTEQNLQRREARAGQIKGLTRKIARMEAALTRDRKARAAIATRRTQGKPPTKTQKKACLRNRDAFRLALHGKKRRLQMLRDRENAALAQADRTVPPICFGGRPLLRERAEIHPNDQERLERWKRRWDTARNGNFLLIGSKEEAAGNQTCQGKLVGDGLALSLRLPPKLCEEGKPRHCMVTVPIGPREREMLAAALAPQCPEDRTALAYRFVATPNGRRAARTRPGG